MNADIDLSTPALLFPAISLLLLAYTNRFLTLASIIRGLHARYREHRESALLGQIQNLSQRVDLIRNMQAAGVLSLLLCVVCMFALFGGLVTVGKVLFGASLILMMISLALSAREIQISTVALKIHLRDLQAEGPAAPPGEAPPPAP